MLRHNLSIKVQYQMKPFSLHISQYRALYKPPFIWRIARAAAVSLYGVAVNKMSCDH